MGDKGKSAADAPSASDIMSHLEMKPILAVAYNRPVSCALALTDDDEAAFLLHRKTPPKKLRSVLKDDAEGKGILLRTKVFFGRVRISASNLVTITVNKEPPGSKWERALRVPLRKAGYPDFVITADASLETESDEEEEEKPASTRAKPVGKASDRDDMRLPEVERRQGKNIPQDLARRLSELIERAPTLVAQVPARKDRITRLAKRAVDMVKAGNAGRATNAVNELDAALRAIPDEAKAETARATAAARDAARILEKVGNALVARVEKMIEKAAAAAPGSGDDAGDAFAASVRPAAQRLLDSGLGTQIQALIGEDDATERGKLLDQALATIKTLERPAGSGRPAMEDERARAVLGKIAQITAVTVKMVKKRLVPLGS